MGVRIDFPTTPAVPALILSPGGRSSEKHLCGPEGSWVIRVPSKAANKRFVGSYQGGWIAATDDRREELVIVNLFSGAEVVLSAKQSMIASIPSTTMDGSDNSIKKIVFSEDSSSSSGCTLAALRTRPDGTSMISVCRVGCPDGGWSARHWGGDLIWDIAFSNGELYGLACYRGNLVRFEIRMGEDGTPVITATHRVAIQNGDSTWGYDPMEHDSYIVELQGKMLKVVRSRWLIRHEPFFRVFELVDVNDHKAFTHKWVEVTSFGDYALFLGWSKAVHVTPDGELRGIKKNHIYYYRSTREHELPDDKVYSVTSGDDDQVYRRKDQTINDGVGRIGYYLMRCHNLPRWRDRFNYVWLYPPDF